MRACHGRRDLVVRMAFNPLLLGAMSDASSEDSGLASGMVNTSFMMGGALGLAILASSAASHTETARAAGATVREALNGGYHLAFLCGALAAALAAVLGGAMMRTRTSAGSTPPPG